MSAIITAGAAIAAALGLAAVAGSLRNRHPGAPRDSDRPPAVNTATDTAGLDLSDTGPTVVHFTAAWCGPCAAARRVIAQVCADMPQVRHVEVDMDANPELARRLSVLSLPTTLVFDGAGRQRRRSAGVPKTAELMAALRDLLT